jgi:hypothetical protein
VLRSARARQRRTVEPGWSNLGFAAGAAADTTVFRLIPYLVVAVFALGAGMALYLKYRNPERYEIVGRMVLEDSHER